MKKHIETLNKAISVSGKIFYNDGRRRIDLKKPIRDLFHESPEVWYVMELCMSQEKAVERVSLLYQHNIIPVIMYFTEGENDERNSLS